MPDTINSYPLTINDVVIYERREGGAGGGAGEVHLWRVRGLPGAWFPTKIAAEVAARRSFPTENPFARDARVTYRKFTRE
jgi:hypothetical protein